MIYGSWNIRCDRQKYLSFWTIFCHFSPLTTQKIKLLKLKKTLGDITILHICTINENHMMYGYWDMECDMTESLSFWTTSCPFTPLRTHKIEILKKWKKTPEDITNVFHKWKSYDVWFPRYGVQRTIFLPFWTVFSPL